MFRRTLVSLVILTLVFTWLVGCDSDDDSKSGDKIKVGLSFSDFATERWKNEEILMTKLLEEKNEEEKESP